MIEQFFGKPASRTSSVCSTKSWIIWTVFRLPKRHGFPASPKRCARGVLSPTKPTETRKPQRRLRSFQPTECQRFRLTVAIRISQQQRIAYSVYGGWFSEHLNDLQWIVRHATNAIPKLRHYNGRCCFGSFLSRSWIDEHPFAGDALSSGTLPRAMRVNSARNQVKCNEYGKGHDQDPASFSPCSSFLEQLVHRRPVSTLNTETIPTLFNGQRTISDGSPGSQWIECRQWMRWRS